MPPIGMLPHPSERGGDLQVNPDLRNLVALQDIDQQIISLKKQITEIPIKTQTYREEFRQMEEVYQGRVALHNELAKQRRARENDVEMMRTRLSRLKDQLMTVKTNKEYTAMLHEIQTAEEQIRVAEDAILDVMEQMELMESKLAEEQKNLKAGQRELEEQIRQAEEAVPLLENDVVKLSAEKTALEERIGTELLARYRRIAEVRKGIVLAEAKDELCSACHVRIRPQVFADLLHGEEIHVCDSCSRILFVRESL
jgi:predicted  nucleic acid-binding Zn-ribbon protein